MINDRFRQQPESIEENAQSNSSFEKLRTTLKKFVVIDRQGELIGEVQDLILEPNHQINFVIFQSYSEQSSRLFLVISKLVKKVDRVNQSVILDINKAETEHFPEYIITETPGMETPEESLDKSVTPAYETIDEDITKYSDVYSSTMPADATEENDIDIASIFEIVSADMEDTIPDSDIYVSPMPFEVESADIQNQLSETAIDTSTPEVLEEEVIRLLGERLIVDRSKRKIGEVIIRKEIETRMVQVPVRQEKLIVEQVSPEHKQLAEIILGQEEISGVELTEKGIAGTKLSETTSKLTEMGSLDNELAVRGEFNSPKIASLLLNAIALERHHGCAKVRVEIVVEDAERQKTYQEWVDRASGNKATSSEL